jgi:hypothetical protein
MNPEACGPFGIALRDPQPWPDDEGEKLVPVYDRNVFPPRLVRIAGWRHCHANPGHRFWSPDIRRVRICDYRKKYRDETGSA